jgi:hypothetical protein
MNEFNTVPPPWPYGETILEQPALIPQILTAMEDLLEETDVSLVHWAQFLNSGVDALGLVDRIGKLQPGFFAFELYARMPLQRVKAACPDAYGCMASKSSTRFSAIVWNQSDSTLPLDGIIRGIPSEFERADVYVVDADFLAGLEADYKLRPSVRSRLPITDGEVDFSGFTLGIHDLVYIEGNVPGSGARMNPGLSVGRALHWYPDRMKNSFAEYDAESGAVYLGANGNKNAYTVVSVEFEYADKDQPLAFRRERFAGSSDLCIRVDYKTEKGYEKSVQFGGEALAFGRGTQNAPDTVRPLPERTLPIGEYAPQGWNGTGLISFFGKEATRDYLETVSFAPATDGQETLKSP